MTGPTQREIHRIKMETMVCKYLDSSCKAMYDIGVGPKTEYRNIQMMMPWIKLFGCEPDPRQYEAIKSQFHGPLWPVAISTQPEVPLHLSSDLKQTACFPVDKNASVIPVKAWTLDYFDEEAGQPDGVLLWMDIEGMELDALQSGKQLLSSGRVHAINLEVRDDARGIEGWCTADEVEAFLNQFGYVIEKEYNSQKTHWDVIYQRRK